MEQENLKLKVSASPHVRSKATTSDIMFDVVIALVPATAFGLYIFGWYAALLVAVCIGSCVGFEAWCGNCNTTCNIEAYRHGELKKYVPWIYCRNDW